MHSVADSELTSGRVPTPMTVVLKYVEGNVDRNISTWEAIFNGLVLKKTVLPQFIKAEDDHPGALPITERYTIIRPNLRTTEAPSQKGKEASEPVITKIICDKVSRIDNKPINFAVTTGRHIITVRRIIPELEEIVKLEYVIAFVSDPTTSMYQLLSPPEATLDTLECVTPLMYNREASEAFKVGIFLHAYCVEGFKLLKQLGDKVPENYMAGKEETMAERTLLASQDDRKEKPEVRNEKPKV